MRTVKLIVAALALMALTYCTTALAGGDKKLSYDDFEKPSDCGDCHTEIYQEWSKSMMAKSYTHPWDEIEYFKLALPHSLKEPKVAGVKEGCIACHSPMAFLTGDIPPPPVKEGSRANEGVSCEICHNIVGSKEEVPYNFSFIIDPTTGKKVGPRDDVDTEMSGHGFKNSTFIKSAEFCATCHDEQSPFGAWVKSTYREWKAGPYSKKGIVCQDCHMHRLPGKSADDGKERPDIAHHVFQGAHNPSKIFGSIDIALYSDDSEISPGDSVTLRAVVFNGKAGHMLPSGSSEERQLWLHVEAVGADGKKYHLPVDKKGFKGEEFTITSHSKAYQDIGEILDLKDFDGLPIDGDIPEGDRIFRRPFFDPKGRMTICQWNTADNNLVDYRIGPQEAKTEIYTWKAPEDLKEPVTINASLYYRRVPSSVSRFLEVPESEIEIIEVNNTSLVLK